MNRTLLVAIVLLVLAVLVGARYWTRRELPFDAARWRADVFGRRSERLRMLGDLLDGGALLGKTPDELVQLLGRAHEPTSAGTSNVRDRRLEWDLVFDAGCSGTAGDWFDPYSVDCRYLVVRFGPDGRVDAVGVVRD